MTNRDAFNYHRRESENGINILIVYHYGFRNSIRSPTIYLQFYYAAEERDNTSNALPDVISPISYF